MAIRTLEIQKQGEGYVISEQAGSNYHKEKAVHQAPNREDAAHFLNGQGGPPDLVDQALDDAGATETRLP